MTTPSHTELAAQAAARLKAELAGMYPRENIDLSDVRTVIAALESPERVQGETCHYPDCNCPTENPCLKGLPTPPTAPAQYSLPDELYDSKDWKAADYAGRVEWLHAMYEAKKMELESFLTLATPSPQAEKQPLSEADEALMRQALEALTETYNTSAFPVGSLLLRGESITALRKRLETSNV